MNREPSQTALTAAAARAAHLLVDREPHIFADCLATRVLGGQAEELLAYHRAHGTHPVLSGARTEVVVRGRFTEDLLARAVGRGVTQYVVLGAGLDTFAYRTSLEVRVFEVDHPATQESKRQRLSAAGIPVPASVSFAGVDFGHDSLAERLAGHGFDPSRPSFVSWLGVTCYLTREEAAWTLAELPAGSELVTDYMLPAGLRDAAGDAYAEAVAPVAAQRGEPWLSYYSPDEMSALLREAGFRHITHSGQREAVDAALWHRSDSLAPRRLSLLAHARR